MSIVKKIRTLIKRHTLPFFFITSMLISILLYIAPFSREFGVNFISEIVGVWITVFLVNKIIEKRERQKRVAIDLRILREVTSIIASYFSIWKHLVWRYAPEVKIVDENDLKKIYSRLINSTQLNDSFDVVSIHDPESWKLSFYHRTIRECFENYHTMMLEDIKLIIDNFKVHIEPELLGSLLELTESTYFRELDSLTTSKETDIILNEFGQDTNKLVSYLSGDLSHIDKIVELRSYCQKLSTRIAEFVEVPKNHYNLKQYFINPIVHHTTLAAKSV